MSTHAGFSSPQEEAHPGQKGHDPWISHQLRRGRWPQLLYRAHLGSSRLGRADGHLQGICSPLVYDCHLRRSEATWTSPVHGSQPVGSVIQLEEIYSINYSFLCHHILVWRSSDVRF